MGKGRKRGGVPARRGVKEETAAAIRRRQAGGEHGAPRWHKRRAKSEPVGRVAEADPLPRSRSSPPRSGLVVCRACSTAWGCKSPTQPDGGEVLAKRKGVVARRRLKAAWSKAAT